MERKNILYKMSKNPALILISITHKKQRKIGIYFKTPYACGKWSTSKFYLR